MLSMPATRSVATESDLDVLGIEDTPRPLPFIKVPPNLTGEHEPKKSSGGKWIFAVVAVVLVAALSGWFFMFRSKHAVPVASVPAAQASTTQPNEAPVGQAVTEVSQSSTTTSAPSVTPKNQLNVTPAASTAPATAVPNWAKPSSVQAAVKAETEAKQEKKPQTHEEPIVLAASTARVPRPADDAPAAAPISMAASSMNQIALPGSNAVPKLVETPRVRTGGNLIRRVEPIYPPIAKSAGIQGQVELQFHINKDGSVDQVHRLSGHPLLSSAAIEAVKRWRYEPVKLNGEPIDFESSVKLNFTLAR
jgi:TonB family protein